MLSFFCSDGKDLAVLAGDGGSKLFEIAQELTAKRAPMTAIVWKSMLEAMLIGIVKTRSKRTYRQRI